MHDSSLSLRAALPAHELGHFGLTLPVAVSSRPAPGPRAVEVRPMTMREVQAAGYVVFHDDVYDIARFAEKHAGGAFLKDMLGQDITIALDNAHGMSGGAAHKVLRRCWVAPFVAGSRDPLERDLLALRRDLRREGFFEYGARRLAFDTCRWAAALVSAVLLFQLSHALSFLCVLAGTIDVVWWIHDAGHDAVFSDPRRARTVIEWLGVLVLGMPQEGYHYGIHRVHHGVTNVVGADRALDTGPLSWDEATAENKPRLFRRGRLGQWFLGILPLAGPALLWGAVQHCIARRQWKLVTGIALRWVSVVCLSLWLRAPSFIVAPWVAGSILAFMAGLNHFHMPMSHAPANSHVRAIFERTQNIEKASLFWHWLSGGLDLHVEHHLFPSMPSFRYRAVTSRVRALAAAHELPYHATSASGAVMSLVRTLLKPPPRVPPAAGSRQRCPFHAVMSLMKRNDPS